eukprot:353367-Chlamydomonas_euryale.AAC.8
MQPESCLPACAFRASPPCINARLHCQDCQTPNPPLQRLHAVGAVLADLRAHVVACVGFREPDAAAARGPKRMPPRPRTAMATSSAKRLLLKLALEPIPAGSNAYDEGLASGRRATGAMP